MLPPAAQRVGRSIVEREWRRLDSLGSEAPAGELVVDIDASLDWAGAASTVAPCLLRSRTRGLWLMRRGRRMTLRETARLQGICAEKLGWPDTGSGYFRALGNAMTQCLVEDILR